MAWDNLKMQASVKQEKLMGANEIQRFNRDADETITWITEKDTLISSEYGKDLASVQTLQRKHETMERDLAALEDKVRTVSAEADRLCNVHPEHSVAIKAKHEEITSSWETLIAKAKEHRQNLDESYFLHRYVCLKSRQSCFYLEFTFRVCTNFGVLSSFNN